MRKDERENTADVEFLDSSYRYMILNVLHQTNGLRHVAEVQLTFRDLSILKHWSHRVYKIQRICGGYQELLDLQPIMYKQDDRVTVAERVDHLCTRIEELEIQREADRQRIEDLTMPYRN